MTEQVMPGAPQGDPAGTPLRSRDPRSPEARDHARLWHPFTQMFDWMEKDPLIIESGQGVRVKDIHGREYYDANSSLWVNVHGHRHPSLDEAIRLQIDCIAHTTMLGLSNPMAIELADRLTAIAPEGLNRVFYSDSGSEAVEIALKIAFQYWRLKGETGRDCYLTLEQAYHGDTLGCVSVGGMETFHSLFRPLLFKTHRLDPLDGENRALKEEGMRAAASGVGELIAREGSSIAAVIVEPMVQAAAGMLLTPPGFLKSLEDLCRRTGILLIVDEVATGFGRTGRMFACEHEGIRPDLMTVAKGLTGGYLPLAATLVNDRVFEPFRQNRPEAVFYHGHSYTGNALGCAAALANLDIFVREQTIEQLAPKIQLIQERLASIASLVHVLEIRQIGMMVGIEITADRQQRIPYPADRRMGAQVCYRARELGLITRPLGDVIVFMPPLCSTGAEIEEMIAILHRALRDVTEMNAE